MPIDPAFFETRRPHEVGQGRPVIAPLIEDGRRLANDFLARLLAFAHFGPPKQLRDQLVSTCMVPDIGGDRTVSCCIQETGHRMSAITGSISFPNVAAARPAINPWIIAVTVTLATFMELLDTAIANVALPHIAGGLAVSYD